MASSAPAESLRRWWQHARSPAPIPGGEATLEHQLGWVRLVAGLAVLAAAWGHSADVATGADALLVTSGIAMSAMGATTLLALPRLGMSRRAAEVSSLVDAVLLAMLLPFGGTRAATWTVLVLVLLAIIGGLRLGRAGVVRNLTIAAPFELARLALSSPGAPDVLATVVAVLLAVGTGLVVADVATAGRQARQSAAAGRESVRRDQIRTRRLEWELEVQAEVVRRAGTRRGQPALDAALDRVHAQLDLAGVHLLVMRDGNLVVSASTDQVLAVDTVVTVLPGGPRDRAMSLGTVAAATHDDLEAIASSTGRARGSVVAAPLLVGGRLLGLLVGESGVDDLLHRRDALLLGRLARALAPFVALVEQDLANGPGPADDPG